MCTGDTCVPVYDYATLSGADFTDAEVRGASFHRDFTDSGGISLAQLYSTASYQAHDLRGIGLVGHDLASANFAGQNLTHADFYVATLSGADFTNANLTNANFLAATLTDADFTDAVVRGAIFPGITLAQLYSTASYQARDLSGINFAYNNFAGGNFAEQNLTSADFKSATLTSADFREANLTNVNFYQANVTGANFTGENLTNASFSYATLTDADFTGAEVRGASFEKSINESPEGTGITLAQLYSTASYQAKDLSDIDLNGNDLASGNFAGQNFANAEFVGATLTDAEFAGADVSGANFAKHYVVAKFPRGLPFLFVRGTGISSAQLSTTANYQAGDLNGINFAFNEFAAGSFAGQNLTNANFGGATLTDADFTGAEVRGVSFDRYELCNFIIPCGLTSGITLEQLYSTASYQERDLRGVSGLDLSNAITTNLILPNGHIDGLELDSGRLVVRDYDGTYDEIPIPITIDQRLAMGPGGTLRLVFEADDWDSTISFAPGIPVTLGGTLELAFTDDVNLASQVGRKFDLFDWTGDNPSGAFAVSSPYTWDLSNLYTTGEVTLISVPEPVSGFHVTAGLGVFVIQCRRRSFKRFLTVEIPPRTHPGEQS